jgi:hypothetical protein
MQNGIQNGRMTENAMELALSYAHCVCMPPSARSVAETNHRRIRLHSRLAEELDMAEFVVHFALEEAMRPYTRFRDGRDPVPDGEIKDEDDFVYVYNDFIDNLTSLAALPLRERHPNTMTPQEQKSVREKLRKEL